MFFTSRTLLRSGPIEARRVPRFVACDDETLAFAG
jgi:hypothetical protein